MQLLNQQLLPRLNPNQFSAEGYDKLALAGNAPYIVHNIDDSGLHKGTVFRFDLECLNFTMDCMNHKIELTNKAELIDYDIDYIGGAEDIFYDDRDTDLVYVLTNQYIYILDRDLNFAGPKIILGVDPGYFICDYMTEIYSDAGLLEIILVFCQNVTDPLDVYETYVPVSFMTVDPVASPPISMVEI